jgi:hypothetical protein
MQFFLYWLISILKINKSPITLESGIDVGQGITVGPGKFVKKNKRRALNKHRASKNVQIYVTKTHQT